MINKESKQNLINIGIIALITFLVSYLAFFMTIKHHLKNFSNPFYRTERFEKLLQKQEQNFEKDILKDMENPFVPKMRPMIVNLVKELNEYKVIIDLTPFDGDENNINITVKDDELTVIGQLDKKVRGTEKIINFAQTYYLEEKINNDKIINEKRGDKYIVIISFK